MANKTSSVLSTAALFTLTSGLAFGQAGPEAAMHGGPEAAASAPAAETAARRGGGEVAGGVSASGREKEPESAGYQSGFLPSFDGPTGLFHLSTTDVGPVKHFRFGLHGEYFTAKSFLVGGDEDSRLRGSLAFAFTPSEYLEIFSAILASNNENKRPTEPDRRDPQVIKAFGDFIVGPKVRYPFAPGRELGFELGLKFISSISRLSFSGDSTSVWLGPLFTADLRKINGAPFRFTVNANYFADNSKKLNPYASGGIYSPQTQEVSNFAYGIQRSRARFGLGVDAPLDKVMPDLPIDLLAEYHAEVVMDSADPEFKNYMKSSGQCGGIGINQPGCRENTDMHWLTFGVRARVADALTLDAGVDVALRSVGFPYGPALPPYNVLFGASVPLDVGGLTRVKVVTKTVVKKIAVEKPAVAEGYVRGVVKSSHAGAPVAGAVVAVTGRAQARAATDPDGTFRTVGLAPGPADLEVTAPGFDPVKVNAVVAAGRPSEVEVTMNPRAQNGNVRGRVADPDGRGVEASLKFMGPDNFEARSDASGAFSAALPVGTYAVRADASGFLSKEGTVDVALGEDRSLDFTLRARPAKPAVGVSASGIVLKQGAKFKKATSELDPSTLVVLDEVADALATHPELKKVRIEAHWDGSLSKAKADDLTRRQAETIRDYLVKQGVAPSRLEPAGMGSTKPLVPNIGAANKAKNRRVEFVAAP